MFWGIEVSKTPVKFIPSFDLHITTACLTALAKDTGRNVLQVQYDGKTYSLCSLKLGAIEHSVLDTNFEEGKEIVFSVSGNNSICLTGYFVDSMYGGDDEEGEEEEDDEEEEVEQEEEEEEEEMEEDDEEEDSEEDNEELENQILQQTLKRKAQLVAQSKQPEKKSKQEQAKPATPEKKVATPVKEQPKQVEQKKVATPEKKVATPVKEQPKQQVVEKKPTKSIVTLPNGLQYEDLVVGNGVSPKSGKKVSVKYIGKLTNGKTFDSSLRTPFSFRIGIREVIRGWDIGVASMKVGGKRRLTIPSDLAYGRAGAPPSIPPNATLIFDVELVSCAQ